MFKQVFKLQILKQISNGTVQQLKRDIQMSSRLDQFGSIRVNRPEFVINNVDFKEVKDAILNEKVVIIDVRQPEEIKETGSIPGSINIPLDKLQQSLIQTPPQVFKEKYGKEKPGFMYSIIFTCRTGRRSEEAVSLARKLGYKNVKNYDGGWLDWEANTREDDEIAQPFKTFKSNLDSS